MKRNLLLTLAAIVCGCLQGCSSGKALNTISQITITSDAGSILPELQWHEEITITKDGVSLVRNGRTDDTEVNVGSWAFAVDVQAVAALFAELEGVDLAAIERVEPDDPPDGGESESYTIVHGGGKTFYLGYDPGVTYTHGELLVVPIDDFIRSLDLAVEALHRYAVAAP